VEDHQASAFAAAVSQVLAERLWYLDLRSNTHTIVAFPRRVVRYRHGDDGERTRAQEIGAALHIPTHQLDWPV
jgi:hypothetical protein